MSLVPDARTPGLWINPTRSRGTPGTFAVVVGVSAYDHLAGGKGPAATNTYGLGQLAVSALTAHRFFQWLADTYSCARAPIGQCWLLLAPTLEEKAIAPQIDQHTIAPTFENCSQVLRSWVQSMQLLAQYYPANAEASRAIFFFSGHGIEVVLDKQLLCPNDYLKPPNGSANDAISTLNLWLALGTLPIGEQVLLYDACRNDTTELKLMNQLEGAQILNVTVGQWYANRCAIKATATGPGTNAWQPGQPAGNDGKSVFGRALLEALCGQGGIQFDCSADPCRLLSPPLETYLRSRVPELLQSLAPQGEPAPRQPVRFLGENATAISITEIPRGGAGVSPPTPRAGPDRPTLLPAGVMEITRIPKQVAAAIHDNVYQHRRVLSPPWNPALAADYNAAFSSGHEIFGSEEMTRVWVGGIPNVLGARVFSYAQNDWVPPANAFEVHYVEHSSDASMQNIVLSVHTLGACWLELSDSTGMRFGSILPGDNFASPLYLVKINLNPATTLGRPLGSVEVGLARDNQGLLAKAYELWEKYRSATALEAADSIDMVVLEQALKLKLESPLAATIAGIILLRAGRYDLLHDWLENLAQWFPDHSDGPVLRAEQLLRQQRTGASPLRAAYWLSQLVNRRLPQTAETMSFLVVQLETLLRRSDLGDIQKALEQVRGGMTEALRYLRSGGLFVTYAGQTITPDVARFSQQAVPAEGR
jgi:hypothetical protein